MEEHYEDHKTVFLKKIREISFSKSLSVQRDKQHWEGFECGVKLSTDEKDNIPKLESLAREHINDMIADWATEKITKHTAEDPLPRTHTGPFDINEIAWHPSVSKQTGQPFERSVDRENPHFQNCVKLLTLSEKGSCVIDGYFVWLFTDNITLGRKPSR